MVLELGRSMGFQAWTPSSPFCPWQLIPGEEETSRPQGGRGNADHAQISAPSGPLARSQPSGVRAHGKVHTWFRN